ncbi:MAG: efflux RND transporter periplasmic adaptor subunit [Ignavibacteriales bacterium]|nr:efflux RND transporter periplasmic adaptor subunit [Ignavibacteriales bacterium]
MRTVTVVFVTVLLTLAGCATNDNHGQHAAREAPETPEEYYTCPMHPSVRSDRPGACPVCGMALVRKTALQEATPDDLTKLRQVSLSPTQRVLANVSTLRATVSARFRGRIEKLHVAFTGDQVRKGQPLFDLYSPDLISAEQDYLLASHALSSSADESLQSGSQQLLNASRDRLKIHFGMTDAQIDRLESSGITRNTVTFFAPISGTVITKEILEGQYVDEGTSLYEVADLSRVWVYFDMYENDIGAVKLGQEVRFNTDAYPGESFVGTVTFIDPVVNTETRTVRVRTEAANPRNKLKPRMFVSGRIRIQLAPTVTVSASAILSLGKTDVVWVETDPNVFEPRSVVVGSRSEGFAQILKGLRENENVVVTGGYLIDSESALQVPASSDPHQGHGVSQRTPGASPQDPSASTPNRSRTIHIHVKGAYQPDEVRIRQGETVTLSFFRDEDSTCTEEVVFEEFNIRKQLAPFQTTSIEVTPREKGVFAFTCGMEMVRGKLIVE